MLLPPVLQLLEPLTDQELVRRVVDGDTPVFELLVRRHNQRLFRLARSVLRRDGDAEEVVQETWLRAFVNLPRFEGRSSVVTWLSRIAYHEALRRRRLDLRLRPAEGVDLDAIPAGLPAADAFPPGPEDLRSALARAVDSLPDGMRSLVMLRLVEGLSTRETARSLRLSESNVKVGLHRARALLRVALDGRAESGFRTAFAFASHRCDRIVASVFQRLASPDLPAR